MMRSAAFAAAVAAAMAQPSPQPSPLASCVVSSMGATYDLTSLSVEGGAQIVDSGANDDASGGDAGEWRLAWHADAGCSAAPRSAQWGASNTFCPRCLQLKPVDVATGVDASLYLAFDRRVPPSRLVCRVYLLRAHLQ